MYRKCRMRNVNFTLYNIKYWTYNSFSPGPVTLDKTFKRQLNKLAKSLFKFKKKYCTLYLLSQAPTRSSLLFLAHSAFCNKNNPFTFDKSLTQGWPSTRIFECIRVSKKKQLIKDVAVIFSIFRSRSADVFMSHMKIVLVALHRQNKLNIVLDDFGMLQIAFLSYTYVLQVNFGAKWHVDK